MAREINGYKVCNGCGKDKLVKYFSKRTSVRKDGSAMYATKCKACMVDAQKRRVEERRIAQQKRITVDPKFLVRGTISMVGNQGAFGAN